MIRCYPKVKCCGILFKFSLKRQQQKNCFQRLFQLPYSFRSILEVFFGPLLLKRSCNFDFKCFSVKKSLSLTILAHFCINNLQTFFVNVKNEREIKCNFFWLRLVCSNGHLQAHQTFFSKIFNYFISTFTNHASSKVFVLTVKSF